MAEVSYELIFEVLKQVRQRLDRVDHKIDEVKSELTRCACSRFPCYRI